MNAPLVPGPMKVGIVCDYLEERWPSMDLVAEMVFNHLAMRSATEVVPGRIQPAWNAKFVRLPGLRSRGVAHNADRVYHRYLAYPREIREIVKSKKYDLYHIIDHSYSQLVRDLPTNRVVVTCHDLDTFRCLLEPEKEPRPRWFKALARRSLSGMQRAAAIACDSEATKQTILRHDLVSESRLKVVYLAVHPECSPDPDPPADHWAEEILGPVDGPGRPSLLHVGSNIPRKRIDVLLRTFAGVRKEIQGARLIKVGGKWTAEQQSLVESLGIGDGIVILPFFDPTSATDRARLAAVYRRAAVALQPSDAEGFGLPVAEAQACGTPVLASDIAVLREVGGEAGTYREVGNIEQWSHAAIGLVEERERAGDEFRARREQGIRNADRFSWKTHVGDLVQMYRCVLEDRAVGGPGC